MGPLPWSAEQNARADSGASERGIGPRPHGAASGTPAKARAYGETRSRECTLTLRGTEDSHGSREQRSGGDTAGAGPSAAVAACAALVGTHEGFQMKYADLEGICVADMS